MLLQILEAGKTRHQPAASQQDTVNQREEAGAYVVAPCPHDGQCPMEGTKSWCHFAQRFQRSDLQRRHKVWTWLKPLRQLHGRAVVHPMKVPPPSLRSMLTAVAPESALLLFLLCFVLACKVWSRVCDKSLKVFHLFKDSSAFLGTSLYIRGPLCRCCLGAMEPAPTKTNASPML